MTTDYQAWIASYEQAQLARFVNIADFPPDQHIAISVRGLCASAVRAMVAAFPELRAVRGHYNGVPHWWCVTPAGAVVDPTGAQFIPGGRYVEYTGPDPIGKCINCGELVWSMTQSGDASACSPECLAELMTM